ncbi:MAG: FAD-dependent oxidoreductase [Leptospiraceae bacterium]|nr:FAD-dependent oxidoreductase [Leptospiraceae bacterium]
MAKVIVMGGGISGHTTAMMLRRLLGKKHDVLVVTPNSKWNWIPSNIWVGVGVMKSEQVTFDLKPVYEKLGIIYHQAKAISIFPEGDGSAGPFIEVEYTDGRPVDQRKQKLQYDYLVNATGPKLKFEATPGLGPDENTHSVCTFDHAASTARALDEEVERMKRGEKRTFLVGTGHGTCTCQGAAFEYILNLEHELQHRGVRDRAEIRWMSNEEALGDFGMGGLNIRRGGYVVHARTFAESLFAERGIGWTIQAAPSAVEEDGVHYENLHGEHLHQKFDFAMLLPPFSGVPLQAFDARGKNITDRLFAPNGFMKVDADYSPKPWEQWKPSDWPRTYQNPDYANVFAVGIAFAPPHAIARPRSSPRGTPIFPTPPRTGMPSAVMGNAVAHSIAKMIKTGSNEPAYAAPMSELGAACIASAGAGLLRGSAASLTVFPLVPDFEKYPETGRSLRYTTGEIGLAGHWLKYFLHHLFLYKAKGNPGWAWIPE